MKKTTATLINNKNQENYFLIFELDEQLFGIPVALVERVLRAVAIRELPEAPESVLGMINFHGRIIPVIDIRQRLFIPERDLTPEQRLVIVSGKIPFCFYADSIYTVTRFEPFEFKKPQSIYPDLEKYLAGVVILDKKTVLLFDDDNILRALQLPAAAMRIIDNDQ